MANGSFEHRGPPRAETFLSRGRESAGAGVPFSAFDRIAVGRSVDRSIDPTGPTNTRVSSSLVSFYFARGKATARYEAISSARLTKVRRGPAKRLRARARSRRFESGSTRIDVTCPIIVQGRVRKKSLVSLREERRNEAKWIGARPS